ncbi:hypothetical protein ACFZBU_39670 [Embleya sp. NPDC008237]|uniref:hypothetical protein n=1 Tax=Embleya sp. NPDC008237 TaxID=3363978 RepID=UPI0036EC690A
MPTPRVPEAVPPSSKANAAELSLIARRRQGLPTVLFITGAAGSLSEPPAVQPARSADQATRAAAERARETLGYDPPGDQTGRWQAHLGGGTSLHWAPGVRLVWNPERRGLRGEFTIALAETPNEFVVDWARPALQTFLTEEQ